MTTGMTTYDGVILAGGSGRRCGGAAKPSLRIGSRRLIDAALEALAGAGTTVVVGAPLATRRAVVWAREDPQGGGPVAGLAAAVPLVSAASVVLLAADLPFVTAEAVEELVRARGEAPAALAIDDEGRDQPLLACYSLPALAACLPAEPRDAPLRALVAALALAGPLARISLAGEPPPWWDCDTDEELARARAHV
jgi:molybdopterin-guanine dinucleotide biosynthesis protein A